MAKTYDTNKQKIKYYYGLLKHEDQLNQMFDQSRSYKEDTKFNGHTIITESMMRTKNIDEYDIDDITITKSETLSESIYNVEYIGGSSDKTIIYSPFYFEDTERNWIFSPIYFICQYHGDTVNFITQIDEKNLGIFDRETVDRFQQDETDIFIAKDVVEINNIVRELLGSDYMDILSKVKKTSRSSSHPTIDIKLVNEFMIVVKDDDSMDNPMLKSLISFYEQKLLGGDTDEVRKLSKSTAMDILLNKNNHEKTSLLYRTNRTNLSILELDKASFAKQNKKHLGSLSTDYPMAESQRISLLASDSELRVVPVNGPPGTGKTALLRGILANYFVNKVMSIKPGVLECRDRNSEVYGFKPVLGASSVNQAIINIIDGINDAFNDSNVHRLMELPPMLVGSEEFDINGYFVPLLGSSSSVVDSKRLKLPLEEIYRYVLTLDIDELEAGYIENYNTVYSSDHDNIYDIAKELYESMEENIDSIKDSSDQFDVLSTSIEKELKQVKNETIDVADKIERLTKDLRSLKQAIPRAKQDYDNTKKKKGLFDSIKSAFTKGEQDELRKEYESMVASFKAKRSDYIDNKDELARRESIEADINERLSEAKTEDTLTSMDISMIEDLDTEERLDNLKKSFHILEMVFIHNIKANKGHEDSPMSRCPECDGVIKDYKQQFRCQKSGKWNKQKSKWSGCNFHVFKTHYSFSDKDTKLNPFTINREELGIYLRDGYINKANRSLQLIREVIDAYDSEPEYFKIKSRVKDRPSYPKFSLDKIGMITPIFPMITSTMHGLYSNIKTSEDSDEHFPEDFFDLTLTDESGMILPSIAMPAAYISKKIVVVGDGNQIQPVFAVDRRVERQCFENAFKDIIEEMNEEFDDSDPELIIDELYSRVSMFENTLMDMANDATYIHHDMMGSKEKEKGELWLREHYRCKDTIIKFSNYIIYKDILKPMLFEIEGEDNLPFYGSQIFKDVDLIDVDTVRVNNTSKEERDTILDHIIDNYDLLLETYPGSKIEDIVGIVTPFNNQADSIRSEIYIRDRRLRDITVGTVHKFQGSERNVMYFSPVVCSSDDTEHFINRDEGNMMNVAVSRAKHSFIVVGSKIGMRKVGGYTQQYVEYVENKLYLKDEDFFR